MIRGPSAGFRLSVGVGTDFPPSDFFLVPTESRFDLTGCDATCALANMSLGAINQTSASGSGMGLLNSIKALLSA